MDIDTMPAGREMDALIAERVMGWYKTTMRHDYGIAFVWFDKDEMYRAAIDPWEHHGTQHDTWSPSTDIAAAWMVVEKIPLPLYIERERPGDYWLAVIDDDGHFLSEESTNLDGLSAAICRAALKATEKE